MALATKLPLVLSAILLAAAHAVAVHAQSIDWRRHHDTQFGYRIDLPLGMFEIDETETEKLALEEVDGRARIDVYAGENPENASLRDFAATMEQADWVKEVTYRASGDSWFVLSGYYRQMENEAEPPIFYAKFMFNEDRTRFSGFEISYPQSEKERFDPIVTRIEKSLRAPS